MLSDAIGETSTTVSWRPSHKRVISIQSASTDATLGEDEDCPCSETEFSDMSPRTPALTALFVSSMDNFATTSVKNTFVEMDMPRPLEWDGCFETRGVQSAPGSVLVLPPAEGDLPPWVELDSVGFDGEQGDSEEDGETSCSPNQNFSANALMTLPWAQPFLIDVRPEEQTTTVSAARPTVVTLRLAEILEPSVGLAAQPTVGSAGHGTGRCKPCAFVWKESGCQSGISCKFCHVCDPSEKKRRRKAKLQLRRNRSIQKTKVVLSAR